MEHIHGPFAGLEGASLFKKMYRGNSQTYADINEEFFSLIGGQDNLLDICRYTEDKKEGLTTYLLKLADINKTEFCKKEFCARMICDSFWVDFHDDEVLAHVTGDIKTDLEEFSMLLKDRAKIKTAAKKKVKENESDTELTG